MSDNDITRILKRRTKITRTLVRLKHSLRADDEIDQKLDDLKAQLTAGQIPQLEAQLDDILGSE